MAYASAHPSKYYRDKHRPLTRDEAIEIISAMPYLVASSYQRLLESMLHPRGRRGGQKLDPRPPIMLIKFEVAIGARSYTFEEQPFVILRQITQAEFLKAAPWAAKGGPKTFYYEVSTD